MKYTKGFSRFIEKYSFKEVLYSIETLIRTLLKNILNNGSISFQVALSPVLLLVIVLLFLVIITKKLLINLHDVLLWFYKLQRNLFVVAIQEVNFYWEMAGRAGSNLVAALRIVIRRILGYMEYLLQKIFDDSVTYKREHGIGSLALACTAVAGLAGWLVITLLALGMSLLLLLTFFTGLALLHQSLRPRANQPATSPDTVSDTAVTAGVKQATNLNSQDKQEPDRRAQTVLGGEAI